MDNYQVIFNQMGYDFDTLKDYYEELGSDFITNYEPFVGMKFYPSAVDYNIVTIIGDIFEEYGSEMISAGIIGSVKALIYLAKKVVKYKNKYNERTTPTIEINYNNFSIYISDLNEDSFTEDLPEKINQTIKKQIQNYDHDLNDIKEDQFYMSVCKNDKTKNGITKEVDNDNAKI